MQKLPATVPAPLSEADYDTIESAVMETMRGRWFLAEFGRRNRHADTTAVLAAIDRLEAAVKANPTVDRMRVDIVDMAKAIARTKAEIASIKPDAEHQGKFGEATEELDSIVNATEDATSNILEAAEQVQEIAWTLREQGLEVDICDLLDTRATEVYTACSFQDLTGQRTRKVIHVLRYLEGRINAMINIWGLEGMMAAEAAETAKAEKADAHLLNGPARPGLGLDQADVDVVMGPAVASTDGARKDTTSVTAPRHTATVDAASIAPSPQPIPIAEPSSTRGKHSAGVDSHAPHDSRPQVTPTVATAEAPLAPAPGAPRSSGGNDPLAPVGALSPDEKLALFS
jgi:chemotaxis protein CheZ